MNPIFKVQNLTVAYENINVLENIGFEVFPKDYLCIVGENGAGKSTLVKTLLGFVKAKSGKIEFSGENPVRIGYLSQQTPGQRDFPATVNEVVMQGCIPSCKLLKFYGKAQKEKAKEYMEYLGIYGLKNRSVTELSGGQRRRVFLARAILAAEKVIILDEPTSGLSLNAADDFYKCIVKLNKEKNITVIMVTHDIKNALKYSNKVLHLEKSSYFFGSTEDYIKHGMSENILKKSDGEER